MTDWPPPPDHRTRWEQVRAYADGRPRLATVTVRPVQLWGREVLVDQDGRVFCRGCLRMVDVLELGPQSSAGHRVAPSWPLGRLLPLGGEPEPEDGFWASQGSQW